MAEKDLIVQVGLLGSVIVTLTTFWWKLTAKFVRKDILALHVENLNKTFERMETDSKEKWEAINNVAEGQARTEGMLNVMMSNQNKRKGD